MPAACLAWRRLAENRSRWFISDKTFITFVRVARQTQSIASGCSGSRAQSAQRGILLQVEPLDLLGVDRHVDVGREDGEQQRQQPPAAEAAGARGGGREAAPAISATPLIATASCFATAIDGGTIAS